jgi:FtsP/CotA-like multicopper oxidase with cupredoxin domain
VREDYTQEHGLYGNILVVPRDPQYWAPANREVTLVLDDILIEKGKIAPFSQSGSTRTAMGRFGNVMLANGETDYTMTAHQGEVIRLYLTNTANVRIFNIKIPGVKMKLTGGDNGRLEREVFVESVMIAPSERAVVDVLIETSGQFAIEHHTPEKTYRLASIMVGDEPVARSYAEGFHSLRTSSELEALRAEIAADFDRPQDKTINLIGEMPGMKGGTCVED